jgi:hypothetical protein
MDLRVDAYSPTPDALFHGRPRRVEGKIPGEGHRGEALDPDAGGHPPYPHRNRSASRAPRRGRSLQKVFSAAKLV